jgi:hypothetical protein
VQLGDFIQIQGGPALQIAPGGYDPVSQSSWVFLKLPQYSSVNPPPGPALNYTIIRQPRPIPGEAVLYLPDDVAIDGFQSVPKLTAGNTYDILFSPSGTLTGLLGDGTGKIVLWVRDITQDPDQPGDQPLIVIFCRTGRVGGFPVNPDPNLYPPGNPGSFAYYYVLDPRATGF